MKRFGMCLLVMCTIWMLGLAGCNTVKGVGQDLQKMSEHTQDAMDGDGD